MTQVMATFSFPVVPASNVFLTSKPSKTGVKKKSIGEWIRDGLQKPDQLYETDHVLKKFEEKSPKKNPAGLGLGGLFCRR